MADVLDELEARTVFILREAFACVSPLAMLCSMGKDSTALLWMARKAFLGTVPFPVALLDTGLEFEEVYAFRDCITREWQLPLHNQARLPESTVGPTLPPVARRAARKTAGLRDLIAAERYRGIVLGIRRAEQCQLRWRPRQIIAARAHGSWFDVADASGSFSHPLQAGAAVRTIIDWPDRQSAR